MLKNFARRGQLLIFTCFAGAIGIGTLLLKLPFVMRDGSALSWFDACFTATSSVCVTGMLTVSVSDFSLFGQMIVTGLIQLGGLGIMTLSSAILLALGRGLSFSNTLLVSRMNDNFSLRGSEGLWKVVIIYMLVSECVGGIVIYIGALLHGDGGLISIWNSAMLAVSAFCNAGIAPFADNMIGQSRVSQIGCSVLVVFGGLGVYVIYDVLQVFRYRLKRLRNRTSGADQENVRLRLHSKIMLSGSAILLALGTVLFFFCGKLGWFDAFFLSVNSRTAGFYSCPIEKALELPLVEDVLMLFMLTGAGPGSTGGGLKLTTVVVAFAAIYNTVVGNREVLLFNRRISNETVLRAFAVMAVFVSVYLAAGMALKGLYPGLNWDHILFETISALTTTGLSMGGLKDVPTGGRFIFLVLMFVGRLGPFSFMLFLLRREKTEKLRHLEERVILG